MKSLLYTSFSSFRAKFGEFVQQKLGKHHGDHHQTFFFGIGSCNLEKKPSSSSSSSSSLCLLEREREREREMGRVLLLLLLWTFKLKLWKTFVLGHVTESHINSQGAAACEICIHNHCEKCSLGGCDICLPTAACKLPQLLTCYLCVCSDIHALLIICHD